MIFWDEQRIKDMESELKSITKAKRPSEKSCSCKEDLEKLRKEVFGEKSSDTSSFWTTSFIMRSYWGVEEKPSYRLNLKSRIEAIERFLGIEVYEKKVDEIAVRSTKKEKKTTTKRRRGRPSKKK